MEESKKLKMPYLTTIPYAVLVNPNLKDSTRIFFGVLVGLCHTHGYTWASDYQLMDLFNYSEKTLHRHLVALENEGLITRKTYNEKKYTETDKESGVRQFHWRKRRKIYIGQAFTSKPNKDCETDNFDSSNEPVKNDSSNEPVKNDSYYSNTDIENTTTESRRLFSDLSFQDSTEQRLRHVLKTDEDVALFRKRFDAWTNKRNIDAAAHAILNKWDQEWTDTKTKEDLQKESNQQQQDREKERLNKIAFIQDLKASYPMLRFNIEYYSVSVRNRDFNDKHSLFIDFNSQSFYTTLHTELENFAERIGDAKKQRDDLT